jgi:endonuclease/exonuclease/phosphatase family metal-dependent hydrolase
MNLFSLNRCNAWLIVTVLTLFLLPLPAAMAKKGGHHHIQVRVMTRNLYLGADIFRVVEAAMNPVPNPDGLDVPRAVAEVFRIMQATNFYDRAESIADEIAMTTPDVIGIQEASTYYVQTPSDFPLGNPVAASEVFIDFYTVLNAALEARGLNYQAFAVAHADIEMPMVDPASPIGLSDVRLVDHDMILVKKKLAASLVAADNYQTNLRMDIAGVPVVFNRGYLVVDVAIKHHTYRFVNTHLEIRGAPGSPFRFFQAVQMHELLSTVAALTQDDPRPVIMVGDFNSAPDDVPGTAVDYYPPYQQALDAGFLDAWLEQRRYDEGYTSGFDEFVSDPTAQLTSRIDHVFLDGGNEAIERVKAMVVGDEVADMTPNGLWPSDHAGVVARIKFGQPSRRH